MNLWNRTKRLKILVRIIRYFNPQCPFCRKCGLPWNWCKPKSVRWSERNSTSATCDICWGNSTLTQLRSYYTETYRAQEWSLLDTPYEMDHTLEHLLKCVENEYYSDKANSERQKQKRKKP